MRASLETSDRHGKKRVLDIGNNDAQSTATARGQASCVAVGIVFQLSGNRQNAVTRFWHNSASGVEGVGDGRGGYSGCLCYIMDCDIVVSHPCVRSYALALTIQDTHLIISGCSNPRGPPSRKKAFRKTVDTFCQNRLNDLSI